MALFPNFDETMQMSVDINKVQILTTFFSEKLVFLKVGGIFKGGNKRDAVELFQAYQRWMRDKITIGSKA